MRIIAGKYKGRSLRAVKGMKTRPTTDKVKESIFNIIGPYFDGGLGLDLFAGSGGLGIEAISRGLNKVIFIDRDPKAVETIRYNVKQCNIKENTEIYRNDANRALKAIYKRRLSFKVIFLDPPYQKQNLVKTINQIGEMNLLVDQGVIVTEHSGDLVLPESIGEYVCLRHEKYSSTTAVTIYGHLKS